MTDNIVPFVDRAKREQKRIEKIRQKIHKKNEEYESLTYKINEQLTISQKLIHQKEQISKDITDLYKQISVWEDDKLN